jgi:hypothetical protein
MVQKTFPLSQIDGFMSVGHPGFVLVVEHPEVVGHPRFARSQRFEKYSSRTKTFDDGPKNIELSWCWHGRPNGRRQQSESEKKHHCWQQKR